MSVGPASLRVVDGVRGGLHPQLRDVLELEGSLSGLGVTKERAVRERLGLSLVRYHQLLDRAIDRPEALSHDPVLVLRLRRLREARRRVRAPRLSALGTWRASPG